MTQKHRERLIAAATVFVATLILFGPWILGVLTGQPRWFEWDVPEQYWPDLVYLCDALHDGTLPYWNPYDRAGYPYYADPQAGLYHPMNWAICAFGESPSITWAELRTILAFPLTGFFGLLWLRARQLSWSGCIVGAVLLMSAPFMRHNWELNLTTAFAWAPLMLWAVERAITKRRRPDGAVLGLSFALCAWVGSPPALWQASTITALYGIARVFEELRNHGRERLPSMLHTFGIALLVSVGLVGVVFVPGLELAHHSVQAGRSYGSIASGALEPAQLVALITPQPGNHLYIGWVALAAIPFALRRPGMLPIAFFGVAAILLTLGDAAHLFRLAYHVVPGVDLFRSPHRYEAWLGPVAALLAATGIDVIAHWPARFAPQTRKVALAFALVGGFLLALLPDVPGPGALALAIAILITAISFRAPKRAWVGALLAIAVLADITAALPPERHTRGGPHPGRDSVAETFLPRIDQGRYIDEFTASCRSGTRYGRRELRGYQDPLLLKSFERVMAALAETPELAMQYDVHYALQGPHFIHGWNRHFLPPPDELRRNAWATPIADIGEARITRFDDALPFAYWVPDEATTHVDGREAALATVRRRAPAAIAVLEGEDRSQSGVEPPLREAALIPATDVHVERDQVAFRIDAPREGWVVVNEAWYPGWLANIDGQRISTVQRANGLVRAVRVERGGRHEITMRFAPGDGRLWRRIWLLTWLVLIGWGVVLVRRRRKASRIRARMRR